MRIESSLVALLLVLFLMGCGANAPVPVAADVVSERVGRTVTAMVRPTATSVPRLNLPTLTPMPTATPWATAEPEPTLDLSGRVVVMVPTPAPEQPATCGEHLRLELEAYDGVRLFAEDVNKLYAELSAARGDCDYAFAGAGRACELGTYVGGLEVAPQLLDNYDDYVERRIGATGRTFQGDVLVHFDNLPGDSLGGCWYYSPERLRWGWRHSAGDHGLFGVDHGDCDGLLREKLLGDGLEQPADVAGGVEYVWRKIPACETQGWSPYPKVVGLDVCRAQLPDGAAVIMWQEGYKPYDGEVCWAYDRRMMTWYDGY